MDADSAFAQLDADGFFNNEDEDKDMRPAIVNKTMDSAFELNPDEQATHVDLSERHGLPLNTIETLKPKLEKMDFLENLDSAKLVEDAPLTANWFMDLDKASVSHDEVDKFQSLEDLLPKKSPMPMDSVEQDVLARAGNKHSDKLGDSFEKGKAMASLISDWAANSIDRFISSVGSTFLPEPKSGASLDQVNLTGATDTALINALNNYAEMPNDQRIGVVAELFNQGWDNDQAVMGFIHSMHYLARNPDIAANFIAEQLTASAPTAFLGGLAGKPASSFIAGKIANKYLAEKVAQSTITASASGLSTTAVSLQANLAQEISQGKSLEQAWDYALTKAMAEGGTNFLITLAPMPGSPFTRAGKTLNAAAEVGKQAVAGGAGAAAANLSVGEEINPGEIFLEAIGETVTAPLDIALAAAMRPELDKIRMANDQQRLFEGLSASATDIMTRARVPKMFRGFVNDVTKDGPVENLFVESEKFREFYQNDEEAQAVFDQIPGILEQMETATPGVDIVIPTADYAAYVAGTSFDQALRGDIRFSADAWSYNEAQEFKDTKKFQETVEQMAKDIAEGQAINEETSQIVEKIKMDLLSSGRAFSYKEAEYNAAFWGAFYNTAAQNTGVPAGKLYERAWFKGVTGVAPRRVRGMPATEIDMALESFRSGKPISQAEMFGDSLLEFVSRSGGIKDDGGELTSMDAQQWHKNRRVGTAGLVQPGGLSVDAIGELLWDAGYFNDRPTEAQVLNAIGNELRGKPLYAAGNRNEAAIERNQLREDLFDQLMQLGIDPVTADPDEVKKIIFGDDGRVGFEQTEKTPYKREQDFSSISLNEDVVKPNGDKATVKRNAQAKWDRLQERREKLQALLDCVNG